MSIPEGVDTITVEGRDLKLAVAGAAEQLGLHPAQVDYKLDMSHFRSPTGASLARSTVKIVAWGSGRAVPDPEEENAAKKARAERSARDESDEHDEQKGEDTRRRRPRKGRDGDRPSPREASKPDTLRGAEEGTTEASDFAQQWFESLLERMDVKGTITGTGSDERVHLLVKADHAGRIVGKRGATLGAIRHLLDLALENKFGKLTIDVDVDDNRPPEKREPRTERRSDRDRGGRSRNRRSDAGRYPESKLRALARRAAEKAAESGQTITIKLELNSFDRRIVHLEVSDIDGVESHSEERVGEGGRMVKYIQIVPVRD